MLRLPTALLALLLLLAPAGRAQPASGKPAAAPAKAEAKDPAKKEEAPLPRSAPRGEEADRIAAEDIPPFMGVFGPPEMLDVVGFRSQVGTYIEFVAEQGASGGAKVATLRYQEVGPAVRGGRWIEVLGVQEGMSPAGVRMLTYGLKTGNIDRIIAKGPDFPPMEMPLSSVSATGLFATGEKGEKPSLGKVSRVGKERITVPLGTFDTERWRVESNGKHFDYWVTSDPRVPFTGTVKLTSPEGLVVASKTGVDAVAVIAVPQKQQK